MRKGNGRYSKKSMIIRKSKFLLISLFTMFLFAAISFRISDAKENGQIYTYYKTIQIEEGDTLNSLASKYNDFSLQNKNAYIRRVMDLNHILDSRITAGENLVIPYYSRERK